MSLTLVIGGTRSGKSARAEALAAATGRPVRYVATANGGDVSMHERIAAHAARRPRDWTTVEIAASLDGALDETAGACVLVDGLGPWIATAQYAANGGARDAVLSDIDRVAAAAERADVIVVAEEAGHGLLPMDPTSRAWLDLLGEATQRLAAVADHVELVVAGRPLPLAAPPGAPSGQGPDPSLRRHGDVDVRPGDADHAVNVLAGGPPDWLREALDDALDAGAAPYPDEREATVALAALHRRTREEIVPTNGAVEALWLLPAALRPALAACVHPAFTEGEAALRAHAVPVARVLRRPEDGFALDPAAVPDEADLVIVGNPASPSGTLDPAGAILALRRPGRTVVVDEAFMDLVPGQRGSLVREPLEDVIVVRSLTKALAIPGLRAGYAVASRALAARLRVVRPPWSANALALAALTAAAQRPEALAAAARRAAAEREDLAARLATVPGVRTWPAAANFCLIEVADGPRVVARLRERAIAVRPADSFPRPEPPAPATDRARPPGECAPGGGARRGGGAMSVRGDVVERGALAPRERADAVVSVVGIGADGWAGLGEAARAALAGARTISARSASSTLLPATSAAPGARGRTRSTRSRRARASANGAMCVLASGDPMLHGIGATLATPRSAPTALDVHPHPSAFALACARLGWPEAEVELVSAVGAPARGRRARSSSPAAGSSSTPAGTPAPPRRARPRRPRLRRQPPRRPRAPRRRGRTLHESTADAWCDAPADPLHAVALEAHPAPGAPLLPRIPGLPDDAYEHDGMLTKRAVRAATLAALAPTPDAHLWDVGAGSGSIAIEWLRAEPTARATRHRGGRRTRRAHRRATPGRSASPSSPSSPARAPEALGRLDPPDAVFVGGGLSTPGVLARCWEALAAGGRIVANAVTLEGEQLLVAARARTRRRAHPPRGRPRRAARRLHRLARAAPVVQWTAER